MIKINELNKWLISSPVILFEQLATTIDSAKYYALSIISIHFELFRMFFNIECSTEKCKLKFVQNSWHGFVISLLIW